MPTTPLLLLNIVSVDHSLFSGQVRSLQIGGEQGELGIFPGHSPLLTRIKPGRVSFITDDGHNQLIYLSGGILEVQPDTVNVLADVAIRAEQLDQQAATEAKQSALNSINNACDKLDYAAAARQLEQAVAQLQIIKQLRQLKRR